MMQSIREIQLFSQLSDENLKELEKISVLKSFYADEILFYEGDDPEYLYILTEGLLRLYKTDNKSNEVYLHQFVPVTMVAEAACFESMKYPATARFITKGQVLKIHYEKFKSEFLKNPDICVSLITSLTKKIKILSNVIHKEMILSSEAKVASFIAEHHELFLTLKNNQIASILNVSPETLSRMLTKLQKEKIISIDKKHQITIHDSDVLHALFS
jgi:CRP/FNR family transcriptional regulator